MAAFFTDEEICEILDGISDPSKRFHIGQETQNLFLHLNIDKNSSKKILRESCSVIEKSFFNKKISYPNTSNTGIVIGHIQSGKTLSFTAVSCFS